MSPRRTTKRSRVVSRTEPYSKRVSSRSISRDVSSRPTVQHSQVSQPGFPSLAQYKQIEAAYLDALSPGRRTKALICQDMFDRIWDVLHGQDGDEKPQFRFWVRNMFTLGIPRKKANVTNDYDSCPSALDGGTSPAGDVVILHDGVPVAVQEQMYDFLCYCHGLSEHGGRDRTCAAIRSHYSWIPKDLVARFVKQCPTCILKKCGNPDIKGVVEDEDKLVLLHGKELAALRKELFELAQQDARDGLDELFAEPSSQTMTTASSNDSVTSKDSTTTLESFPNQPSYPKYYAASSSTSGPCSVPMTREDSMFGERSNGWQLLANASSGEQEQSPYYSRGFPSLDEIRTGTCNNISSTPDLSGHQVAGHVSDENLDPALDLLSLRFAAPPKLKFHSLQPLQVLQPAQTYECLGEPLRERTPGANLMSPARGPTSYPNSYHILNESFNHNITPQHISKQPSPSSIPTRRRHAKLSIDISSLSSLHSLRHLVQCTDGGACSRSPTSPYSPTISSSGSCNSCELVPAPSPTSPTRAGSSESDSYVATTSDGNTLLSKADRKKSTGKMDRRMDLATILN